MLHVLVGDAVKAKEEAKKLAKGRETLRFGEGGEPFTAMLGYLGARGMFSPEVALVLDRPLEDEEGKALILEHADKLVAAGSLVIVIADRLDAAVKKALPKGTEIETFAAPERDEEPSRKIFALSDAFLANDRKKTWVLYRRFIEEGMAPELIHGTLTSQARALVLVGKTKSAEESGLHPFVYSKSKRAAERLGPEKAESLSRELVALYHDARAGKGALEDLLEAFLLKK
ncbi:MAG: hypothetical protein AAB923_01325 [Patescibacteria group bacterium]